MSGVSLTTMIGETFIEERGLPWWENGQGYRLGNQSQKRKEILYDDEGRKSLGFYDDRYFSDMSNEVLPMGG